MELGTIVTPGAFRMGMTHCDPALGRPPLGRGSYVNSRTSEVELYPQLWG